MKKVLLLIVVIATLIVSGCANVDKDYIVTNNGISTVLTHEQYGSCVSENGGMGKVRVYCVKGASPAHTYDGMVDSFETIASSDAG